MAQSSGELIALSIVFSILAIFFVGLRWWARYTKDLELKLDDFLIFAAAVLLVLFSDVPLIILSVDGNLGNHVQRTSNGSPVPRSYLYGAVSLILEAGGQFLITATKCSILYFYRRIFRGRAFAIINWTTIGLVIMHLIAFFFPVLFQSGSDTILDLIILVIPWPFIWKLQMPVRHKLAVTGIFLLGILTIAASIVKVVEYVKAGQELKTGDPDYTYIAAPTVYWQMLYSALGIISACLPTLRPIFHGWSPESVVQSIRSKLSLQSLRNTSKGSQGAEQPCDKQGPRSSDSSGFPLRLDITTSQHKTTIGTNDIEIYSIPKLPSTGIMVQKGWSSSDNVV